MPQGLLPFQYVPQADSGRTGFAGLGLYLDLWQAAGMETSCTQHLAGADSGQGWPPAHVVRALTLLNLAGGESVSDLGVLRDDEGLCRVVHHINKHGHSRAERRAFQRRFRRGVQGAFPSDSAVHRFLERSHDAAQQEKHQPGKAHLWEPNEALRALARVNDDLVAFAQHHAPQSLATLDQDATLSATHKREALHSYKGFKAYQPLNVYWAEHDLVVASEFRDGNVPAGYKKLDLLKQAMAALPAGVQEVRYRADTAAYEQTLLRYLAEGRDPRFGRVEFAVSCDVTDAFKTAVAQVPASDWKSLTRSVDGDQQATRYEWAEVVYVPNWAGHSKNAPLYRFIAIRELLEQLPLPAIDKQLPFPTMCFGKADYKLFGVVSNCHGPGDEIIHWHRQRCGYSEHVHSEMKTGLAGGRLPSGKFGSNAAWWAVMVLALNLNAIMRRLVLKGQWASRRIKALRFALIRLPGQVATHARRLLIKIAAGVAAETLLTARRAILALGPPATASPPTA